MKSNHGKKANSRARRGFRASYLVIGLASIAALGGIYAAYRAFSRPVAMVAEGASQEEVSAIRAALDAAKGLPAWTIASRDEDKGGPIAGAKGADLVFFRPGRGYRLEAARLAPLSPSLQGLVAPPIMETVKEGGALPLLVDHLELSYDRAAFAKAGLNPPESLESLEEAAGRLARGKIAPVALAGGEDDILLGLIAYLAVDEGGSVAYDRLVARIAAGDSLDAILAPGSAAGPEARASLQRLALWGKKGYLDANWLVARNADAKAMVEGRLSPIFITLLSEHRRYDSNVLYDFTTLRFPRPAADRGVRIIGPVLAAAIPSGSPRAKKAAAILDYLAGDEVQMSLASASGEAPAVSSSRTPDLQARDLRSWAIASARVYQGLGADGFGDPAARAEFCAALRLWLRGEMAK